MILGFCIFFCNFVQAFLIQNFLIKFFGTKSVWGHVARQRLISIVLIFLPLELGSLLNINDILLTLINFVILFIFCEKYLLGNKIQHSIIVLISLLLIPLINVNFLQIIILIGGVSFEEYVDIHNPYYYLGIAGVLAIYFIITSILIKYGKRIKIFLNRRYCIIYSLILWYSILVEGVILYLLNSEVYINTYHLGLLFISCGAVGVDIYIVFTICKISEQKYQEDKIKILQFQNICQEQQIKEIKRSEKRIRRLRHDYRNTLLNLKSLIENGNIQESLVYLEKIDNYYIKESKEYIFTGNSLIDVTLNSKFNICHENEIELYSYIIGEYDTIDGFAISIILFNLLDNAIEAERKVEQREVYFEMIMKNEYISCIVKNKINQSVLQNNKGLKTNKKNTEEHGLGIEHVKELVENIDGMFEVFELKDNFCVHVMIPLESLQLQNRKEE